MEQKKKNEKDVLVVRDEKTGEISVVAGLDSKGYPKTAPAKAEHSQDFLRFDRHGDMVDNFFRNFYRQCKEPTRFMLAAHKVDTSEYQRQAAETLAGGQTPETEEAKRENAETEAVEQRRKKRILTKIVYNKKQRRQWKN